MKKALLIALGLVFLTTPLVAMADPYEYSFTTRNGNDDGFDTQTLSPKALNKPGVIGVQPNNVVQPRWYYFDTDHGFCDTASSTLDNARILSVCNVPSPEIYGLEDLLAAKASTTTVGALSSTVSGHTSSLSGINSVMSDISLNLYGSSTNMTAQAASTTNGLITQAQSDKIDAMSSNTGSAYEGVTKRSNAFPIFKSATVASGVAVVHLTADGNSGGTALCTNGVIQDSVSPTVSDAAASYQMSWAFTNSNKTLTVTANKLTTSNILTGVLGQAQANGSVVKVSVWCY